jgi:S1-C subfamily serine protease
LVVTNAHVVAGDSGPSVEPGGKGLGLNSKVVVFDRVNDLAVLRVGSLRLPGLLTENPQAGGAGAVLGYPLNGGFDASPVTVGRTVAVLGDDAYGNGPLERIVLALRGVVRPGNSGGPVIDGRGEVMGTVYGKTDADGGFAVPVSVSRRAVARAISGASDPVGPCTR